MKSIRFHHFAWGLLAYNVAVILGGAFVRATISGDGCGNHWPTCQGALIPEGGHLATTIEFAHRLTTGLDGFLVLGLVAWAFRLFGKGSPIRKAALAVLALTIFEALIGAVLVKQQWVAYDTSVGRAIVMPLHLVNTFLLLTALSLTAWWSAGNPPLQLRVRDSLAWMLGLGLLAAMGLGVSGALTALGDTLFPAKTLEEALRQHQAPGMHFLQNLRIYHPLISIATGLYLAVIAGYCMARCPEERVQRQARWVVIVFMSQMLAGILNFSLMAPVAMQLIHLFLADVFWVSLVLLAAAALSAERVTVGDQSAVGSWQLAVESGKLAIKSESVETVESVPRPELHGFRATCKAYLALTKPRVISLLLFTTLTAMCIAAGSRAAPHPGLLLYLAVGLGLYMAAGAANTINMVLERDLDLAMGRTAVRPTVTQAISPGQALTFAVVLMVSSFALLWWSANLLSAVMAFSGLAFYVIVYTLLLKRRTWTNIVIGGAAGAFPPLVGWAAVTGDLSPLAWCLFGIIFLWTPVHFWALAIMLKDDYARAGVPMLPVVRGVPATVVQIGYYTLFTVAISIAPLLLPGPHGQAAVGWLYVSAAVLLNAVLIRYAFKLWKSPELPQARSLFKYSMLYLALLFLAMAVDAGIS
jgi:protoheme IX farnesyltransferase